MFKLCSQVLALGILFCCAAAQAGEAVLPQQLAAGDRVEVRGNGGQVYLLSVTSVHDGVLRGRCLRSGSEFRGELSAISSVQYLESMPDRDLAPLVTLVSSGLDSHSAQALPQ